MAFHNILFAPKLARGAIGGPMRNTKIAANQNGNEVRNIIGKNSRRRFNIATRGAHIDELVEIIDFFEARMGQAYAFRFKDPMDNKSCRPSQSPSAFDQQIGIGDGIKKTFQLVKKYGDAQNYYLRPIILPQNNSVLIALGANIAPINSYFVNYETGQIYFEIPPANGTIIKAGFMFDIMVRFGNDNLELALDGNISGRIGDIELLEVLPCAN
jgi:uncharacterized protein (TIGR02217 family)